ncbi:uncharacterized protein LOC124131659 [Haliotis rufescens]|uniref:uncharacterized protein LOC124131659 n=1 Tax=Haliotis rufescens TaxID=6454 RepID=UPI00201EBE4E|nr:uncharacterized protein LOC124131659 [Haliotis rufescens]XP_046351046.2 uncharacterized protein LOC124131659 [Haliotis rufescens]XP_048249626.1 uncharacterized protein LOC124131659 [Haliotis rufescens]
MAAASATAGNNYQSSTGLYIVTFVGDVTKAQADGIVVSEGKSFRGMGYVATTLVSMDSEFETNRNKLIQREKANFTPWRVYTTGSCAKFLSVFHAIVTPPGEKQPIQEWKGKMTSLYKKILQEAENEGIHILAVPLLGSGKGKVKPEEAVEVAVHAMFSYKRKSLVKVMLVSDSKDIVDHLATQCAYNSSVKGGKPLLSNTKTGRQLPRPSSSNAKSKSRLGGGTDRSCSSLKRQNGDRSDSSRNSDNNGTCGGGMVLRSGQQLPPRPQSKGQPSCPKGNGKGKITTTKSNPSSGCRPASRTSHSGSGNSHVESEYSHRERRTLYDQGDAQEVEHDLKTRPERTRGGRNHHVGRGNSYSGSGYRHSGRSTWYDQGDAQEEEHDLKTRPERTRNSELKRANGQAGKAYYETKMGEHDEPKALQHRCDISGGAIPKIKNKAQYNEDDDENVVKQKGLAPQRRNYKEEDDDDINNDDDGEEDESVTHRGDDDDYNGGGGAAADDDDAKTIKRLEHPLMMRGDGVISSKKSEEGAVLNTEFSEPDTILNTTGEHIPYRNKKGFSKGKIPSDKTSGPTETQLNGYESGSGKSPNTCDGVTQQMANLSISDVTGQQSARNSEKVNENKPASEICPICLDEISDPKMLDKCGHVFCRICIENSFASYKPVCPSCNMVYGVLTGNQPEGTMDVAFSGEHLPGYETCGTITITYRFPNGRQGPGHPNPGQLYKGTTRVAYLPDCGEGRDVLRLLRKAFDRKLTFTVGRSTTTGQENVVTWNDIHHKTNMEGGPTRFGYPDETYLTRVKEELASKGVTGSS